jgi:hypothetical protein
MYQICLVKKTNRFEPHRPSSKNQTPQYPTTIQFCNDTARSAPPLIIYFSGSFSSILHTHTVPYTSYFMRRSSAA